MIAELARQVDRMPDAVSHAVHQLLEQLIGTADLSDRTEQAIRAAALRRIDPILEATDDLVAAGVELEAVERRLDAHVRTHRGCTVLAPCGEFRRQRDRCQQLQRRWDRCLRRLLGSQR